MDSHATIIDLTGKTIMPALISAHTHVGMLKGTATDAANYTRQNILDQLKKYADYGVLNIQTMGTDRPLLFENGLYDSIKTGLLPGSRMLSAGRGFGNKEGSPAMSSPMNMLFRPSTTEEVTAEMDSLASLNTQLVKIWVDDFAGTAKKMDPLINQAIIQEAHNRNMRVAAHVYYLSDARKLVRDGINMLAHSIRDSVVDDAFLADMKAKKVVYIPTLSLDEYSFIYANEPDWINDPFFKGSLEPGVYEMITSDKYRNNVKNSPTYSRSINGFNTALINLKKISDAGILIALGTDSGAQPVRTQGFSEHLELELMTRAGLTPLQVISIASKNASEALKINNNFGVLEKGKVADLLILNADPSKDIKNTRKIEAVYKAGKKVR
jgi:imidazolonepropionase-like amidohydrolase